MRDLNEILQSTINCVKIYHFRHLYKNILNFLNSGVKVNILFVFTAFMQYVLYLLIIFCRINRYSIIFGQ